MLEQHTPTLRWKDDVIYDGDTAIARFQHDPEGKRHIALADVRLTPRGAPLVFWTLSWHHGRFCTTSQLRSMNARAGDDGTLGIEFTATTRDESFTSHTRLEVSFDSQRQCYRYEVSSDLQLNRFPYYSWREIDGSSDYHRQLAFFPSEFANFLPLGSYNYYAPVDPTPKKWQALLHQNARGGWSRVPQHHLLTPDKYDIHLAPGSCKLGFMDDPGGNPCIELIERVPSASHAGVCWCMNDIHLHVLKFDLNTRHRVRYALYQFTPGETESILARACDYHYTDEEREIYDRPRFRPDHTCDFELGFDFSQSDDCFQFWLPSGEIRYTAWSRGEGRRAGRCLKNSTPEPARVLWQAEGSNAPVVPTGRRYRVTAWLKTGCLDGNAWLEAWDNARPDVTVRADGGGSTADWRALAVEVDVAPGATPLPGRLAIRLAHEGQGNSWFDDVSVVDIGASQPPGE